jgi:hypothetical protein
MLVFPQRMIETYTNVTRDMSDTYNIVRIICDSTAVIFEGVQ